MIIKYKYLSVFAGIVALFALYPQSVSADELSGADTAWILTSTALVLFMTIPGLAFFYAGLVRKKNVLSVLMQCFTLVCLVSVLWVVFLYDFAFGGGGGLNSFIGKIGLFKDIARDSMVGTIPESLFAMFQLTFAIITPALIVGGFAERMRFSSMILFSMLWMIFVYAPITHMVWGGGFLGAMGLMDFAGGTVVHINAGVAALVAAVVMRERTGFPTTPMAPHNLPMTVAGASMLWVGWFGFNAGSALAADGIAANAFVATQIAAGAAAISWNMYESLIGSKPTAIGFASGAVAGLVAITPAAGFVTPFSALLIGIAAGVLCPLAIKLKEKFNYDDSLDVVAVHLIGGIIGALMLGLLADVAVNPNGVNGLFLGNAALFVNQIIAIIVTIAYSFIVTFIIIKLIDMTIGIRVTEEEESIGLDISLHGENFAAKE